MSDREHEEHVKSVRAFDALIRSIGIEQILLGVCDELGSDEDIFLEEIAHRIGKAADELRRYKKDNPGYDDKKVGVPL